MEGESCKRVLGSVSCWKIHCMNHTNVCDDIDWSCTHKSHHLPCRPIMYMDDVGHDFEPIIKMSKLRFHKVKLPDDKDSTE
ncbi:hypothetical protein GQ600_12645 [Phytophthora cactorum]|nr:hypothetical protein GQ600_12645 [Phytophthora cactorum]